MDVFGTKLRIDLCFTGEINKENTRIYMATPHWLRGYLHFISHFVPLGACSSYTINADSLCGAKNGREENAFES